MTAQEKRIQLEVNDSIKIEILGFVRTPPHSMCASHKHPFWELIYTKEGEGIHQIGGEERLLGKDKICLIPPEMMHANKNETSVDTVKLYIGFSYHYSFLTKGDQSKPYFCKDAVQLKSVKVKLRELCDLLEHDEKAPEKIEIGSIIRLVSKVIQTLCQKNIPHDEVQHVRTQNLTEKVKAYLENNLCRSIKLEELGSMFYLSPHYISDTFKKSEGMSVKQYHDMLRMRYALTLLEETQQSISEISDTLGFDSVHYFSRRFKERYGFAPSTLRNTTDDC